MNLACKTTPALLTLSLFCTLGLATGQDQPKPELAADPQAKQLLEEVVQTYQALPAYKDEGTVTLAFTLNDEVQKQEAEKPLAFARPNKLDLAFEPARLISDGQSLTSVINEKYFSTPAPETLTLQSLAANPVAAFYFGGAPGMASVALVTLLATENPLQILLEGAEALKLEEDRTLGDLTLKSILIDQVAGPDVRLLVDPQSKLLRRMEVLLGPDEQPGALGPDNEPAFTIDEISWNSGEIQTELAADAFTFQPADGQEKVESIAALMAGPDDQENPAALMAGQPAPDFTFQVLAEGGKTSKLSKADLQGKVVVIDFWATWCGPCIQELPEIAELISEYAQGDKAEEVRVVALSIDEGDPDDLAEVRGLVEETLKTKNLNVQQAPVGLVALDPQGEIAQKFGVTAIPMLVLLDKQGVVQAVHIGFSPDIKETLSSEIDALLQGKSLVGESAPGEE